jgi:hypothetical protein
MWMMMEGIGMGKREGKAGFGRVDEGEGEGGRRVKKMKKTIREQQGA